MSHILFCIYDAKLADQVLPYLRKAGYEASFAKSVDDAFSLLSQSPEAYDVILSYPVIGGGSSMDLLNRCAAYSPTANIPFMHLFPPPNEAESYDAWEARPVKYEFAENGRDAYVVAFWWQKEYILPAVRAILNKQKSEDM